MINGQAALALGYLAYNVAYVVVLEYWLKPKLIGNRARLIPRWFLCVLLPMSLYGIKGLFYGPLSLQCFSQSLRSPTALLETISLKVTKAKAHEAPTVFWGLTSTVAHLSCTQKTMTKVEKSPLYFNALTGITSEERCHPKVTSNGVETKKASIKARGSCGTTMANLPPVVSSEMDFFKADCKFLIHLVNSCRN